MLIASVNSVTTRISALQQCYLLWLVTPQMLTITNNQYITTGIVQQHYTRAVQKDTELFFLNLLLYLQLNQTCLLQSTPLYC